MVPAWCIVKHAHTRVDHFVVTNHQQARVKNSLIYVKQWLVGFTGYVCEEFFSKVNQLLVLNRACPNNHHVLAEVVCRVKVDNHVTINRPDVINIAKDRLAHHMLSEDVVVDIFHKCLFRVLVSFLKLLPNCVFFHLQVVVIVD